MPNRLKGLDLTECLKNYGISSVNTVQEAMIKTISKKKKCKKAKWFSEEETLQIAEKRREVKGKGEKKRYTYLNAEFQRIARREIRKPSSVINEKK